jgi:hypothetical protein
VSEEYLSNKEDPNELPGDDEEIDNLSRHGISHDLSELGIRAQETVLSIRAEERPFPWWGPFDVVDAIGRALAILGLACLSVIFALILNFEEIVYVSYSGRIRPDDLLGFITAVAVTLCVAGFFAAMGAGILLRRQWAVIMFRSLLVMVAIPVAFGALFLFLMALFSPMLRMDASGVVYSLAGCFVLLIIFFFLLGQLWRFWNAWHVKYSLGYVPVRSLDEGLFDTTRRFARSLPRIGIALIIIAAIAEFGLWGEFRPYYNYDPGAMDYQSTLRRIVLFASVIVLPILIVLTKYRTLWLVIGLAAMLTVFAFNTVVFVSGFQAIQDYSYYYYGYPSYQFWPTLFSLLIIFFSGIFGFWMVAAGIGFAKKDDSARRGMQAAAISMIGVLAGAAILILVSAFSEMRLATDELTDIRVLAIIVVSLFFGVPPCYLLFEVFRYFGGGKAKAWCNRGEYTPPWQVQVDAIKALECVERQTSNVKRHKE